MPPAPDPCPPPSDLEKLIATLDQQSRQQDASDAKVGLAAATKVLGDVQQAEANYKKDYDGLKLAAADMRQFEASREPIATQSLQTGEAAQIKSLGDRVDRDIACDATRRDAAIAALADAQKQNADAQADLAKAEPPYRTALAYRAASDAVAALQARAAKELAAGNYRTAYFLLIELKNTVRDPQMPDAYNTDLEPKAIAYFNAYDRARQKKANLDQATAAAQAAQKKADDSAAKRIDTILKLIGDEKYVPPIGAPAPAPAAPTS